MPTEALRQQAAAVLVAVDDAVRSSADELAFEELFRRLGLSVDWSYLYTTIGDETIRTSQAAFLRNLARGEAYQQDAPTLWDVDFRTAVAQAAAGKPLEELLDAVLTGTAAGRPFRDDTLLLAVRWVGAEGIEPPTTRL